MSNFFAPGVIVSDADVEIGEVFKLSSILEISDLDGNPIVEYRFRDNNSALTSGNFTIAGAPVDANIWTTISADDIEKVRYKGGLTVQSESISVQVRDYDAITDTYRWSLVDTAIVNTIERNLQPPTVTVRDGNVLETEVRGISDLITYSDPEGEPAVGYWLVDRKGNPNGGWFSFDGTNQASGSWFYVPADRLSDVIYHGAKFGNAENIGVRATDGKFQSDAVDFELTTDPNLHRPELELKNRNAAIGAVVGLESLLSWTDLDVGQTMKKFQVYESGAAADGGYLSFNGTRLAAQEFHEIPFADIGQVKYHFADRFDSEVILAKVHDGRYWSTNARGVMRSVSTPKVRSNDKDVQINELLETRFTSMFTKEDTGPAFTQVQIIDESGVNDHSSGHFRLNGAQLTSGNVHTVLSSDFDNLIFKGASNIQGRQQDSVLYRVNNGARWSSWQRINVTTDPVGGASLNSNSRWDFWANPDKTTLTYSFIEHLPSYYDPINDPEADTTTPLAASQRQMFRDIFDIYEAFTDLKFEEVPFQANGGNAVMLIGAAALTDNAQGWAYLPAGSGLSTKPGDIWFDVNGPTNPAAPDNSLGGEGFLTAIHEIGHAIGLKHPHDPAPVLPTSVLSQFYTVMSYIRPDQHAADDPKFYPENPSSLALYDIVETQRLYGINEEANLGNTHHFFSEAHLLSVADAGGRDTLNFTRHSVDETINLAQGTYSSLFGTARSLLIPYEVDIENARGGRGDDTITGNDSRNLIWGNGGQDRINGMGGNDLLRGGDGNDTYVWNLGGGYDTIDETRSGSSDVLEIHSNYAIDKLENDLTFIKLGNNLRINLTFNRGQGQGSVMIRNMGWGGSRIETLRLFNNGTQVEQDIDLNSVFLQASNQPGLFKVSNQQTEFGFIATPV